MFRHFETREIEIILVPQYYVGLYYLSTLLHNKRKVIFISCFIICVSFFPKFLKIKSVKIENVVNKKR